MPNDVGRHLRLGQSVPFAATEIWNLLNDLGDVIDAGEHGGIG